MNGCAFCTPDKDNCVSTVIMMNPTPDPHIKSAQFFFHDNGITVILRTPGEKTDQRIHINTNRCPMCGRAYKEQIP